jgi:hypothetical protein
MYRSHLVYELLSLSFDDVPVVFSVALVRSRCVLQRIELALKHVTSRQCEIKFNVERTNLRAVPGIRRIKTFNAMVMVNSNKSCFSVQ